MKRDLTTALLIFLLMTVITGLVYPGVVTAIAQVVMNDKANGSLIDARRQDGGFIVDRPAVFGPTLFLEPSIGHVAAAVQRTGDRADRIKVRPIRR